MKMDKLELLIEHIGKITSDERLKPVHVSLLVALCTSWITSDFNMHYNISRKTLMKRSRIRSKATYHKTIRELQEFGLLKYLPSYHPRYGSTVEFLNKIS
jgi:hypothetical protein